MAFSPANRHTAAPATGVRCAGPKRPVNSAQDCGDPGFRPGAPGLHQQPCSGAPFRAELGALPSGGIQHLSLLGRIAGVPCITARESAVGGYGTRALVDKPPVARISPSIIGKYLSIPHP